MGNYNNKTTSRREALSSFSIAEKSIMGGYFNIARLNLFKTVVTIFTQAGIKGTYGEEKTDKVLDALYKTNSGLKNELSKEQKDWSKNLQLKNSQEVKLQRLLFKYFPILGPIMASEASYKVYKSQQEAATAEEETKEEDKELKKVRKSNVATNEELMRGVTLSDCLRVVAALSACLTDCRNFYSHFRPFNSKEDQELQFSRQAQVARWLDKVMVASRRIDKQRNSLTPGELEFLTGIDHFLPQDKLDENGNKIIVKGKPVKEFVEYPDYYFRIRGTRPLVDAKGNPLDNEEPRNALTDFGIVFFCTVFLQKTYAKLMLEELRLLENGPYNGSEADDEKKNAILREMLSIYRVRVPKGKRLDSKDDETTLAMDILNELRKCPMPLYDVLGRKGQKLFEDEVTRPNERTPEKAKRLRSTDRFPYLVLRYIDQQKIFSRIRFQVQLGNFRFKFYDKPLIDGTNEIRSWQKEINGFGRLQEIEMKRLQTYANKLQKSEQVSTKLEYEDLYLDLTQFAEDTEENAPYITNHRATYNIHSNRIGMYWEDEQNPKQYKLFSEDGLYLPPLETKDGKAPIQMPAPKASLSVYDLPALMFYQYLLEDSKADKSEYDYPQEVIIKKYKALTRLFSDISKGILQPIGNAETLSRKLKSEYTLSISEVPEKLVAYLSGKEISGNDKLFDYAEREVMQRFSRSLRRLEHYEEDRKMIGSKDNKYGKKSFVDVRHGRLAQYLAESIMDWRVPFVGRGDKLTGLNYSTMQSFLATYGSNSTLSELTSLFKSAKLLGTGPGSHPFLNEVLAKLPLNIEMLYLAYLEVEIEHLKKFLIIKNLKKLNDKELKTLKWKVNFTVEEEREVKTDKGLESKKIMVEKVAVGLIRNTNLAKLPFVHHTRERFKSHNTDYYKALASRYLSVDGKDATIQLPDGLFTPHILKVLKEKYADHEIMQLHLQDKDTCHNAAYLISSYFESVLNDSSQPYYRSFSIKGDGNSSPSDYAHIYDLFNILNNQKENNAFKAVPMTTDEINTRLTKKAVDQNNMFITRKDDNGEVYLVKQITIDIENHLKQMEQATEQRIRKNHLNGNRALKARKNGAEEQEKMKRRLTAMIGDVKRNERTIRRYKTQDIVLFLMAKNTFHKILPEQNGETNELFRLKNVCNNNFLSQTVRFEFPVAVGDYTIKVVQENMALKNYGEFYRFLNDDRLQSLLKQLNGVTEVSHADLTGELANYDQRRSEVFRLMQQLERIAFERNEDKLTDTNKPEFFNGDTPKRNNFRSLISLFENVDGNRLTNADRERLIEIRNAFCHNTYRIDISELDKSLPTIAIQLINSIEKLLKDAGVS